MQLISVYMADHSRREELVLGQARKAYGDIHGLAIASVN